MTATATRPDPTVPATLGMLERARRVTFGPRYVGSEEWRHERTEACLTVSVLAIEREFTIEESRAVANVVRRFLACEHTDTDAAELLMLACAKYARDVITDVERLAFAEVAVPWLQPTPRVEYLEQVQRDVDEWLRAADADVELRRDIERDAGMPVGVYADGFLTSAGVLAQRAVDADRGAKARARS